MNKLMDKTGILKVDKTVWGKCTDKRLLE